MDRLAEWYADNKTDSSANASPGFPYKKTMWPPEAPAPEVTPQTPPGPGAQPVAAAMPEPNAQQRQDLAFPDQGGWADPPSSSSSSADSSQAPPPNARSPIPAGIGSPLYCYRDGEGSDRPHYSWEIARDWRCIPPHKILELRTQPWNRNPPPCPNQWRDGMVHGNRIVYLRDPLVIFAQKWRQRFYSIKRARIAVPLSLPSFWVRYMVDSISRFSHYNPPCPTPTVSSPSI